MASSLSRLAVLGKIWARTGCFSRVDASQRQIATSCCCAADNFRSSEQSWVRRILQGSGPSQDADDTLDEEDIVEVEPQYMDILQTPKASFIERPQTRLRSYKPPSDLLERLKGIALEAAPDTTPDDWKDVALKDSNTKYQILVKCHEAFKHDVPSFLLNKMQTVGDVAAFYQTEVKDTSKFDDLSTADLPPNLKIHWNYSDDSRLELYQDYMDFMKPRTKPKPPEWKYMPS